MAKIKLMSHLVAGYPTDELSLTAARALVDGGADILEIQLAFSDPSADGPAIQGACTTVLNRGYKSADGLSLIKKIHDEFPKIPIYLMSYGSLIFTPGVKNFCKRAADSGVSGMIIPDLPFDFDEGLTEACKENGMENIPVASPSMSEERLNKMANAGFKYIYAALRTGITGTDTTIDQGTIDFIKKVAQGGSLVYGGFGISKGEQSKALAPYVEGVVAGSVFVRTINANCGDKDALTGGNFFHSFYDRNCNVFAALPSLHAAYPLVALVYSLCSRSPRWLTAVLVFVSVGIWFTAVYTAHHYVIDVLAGILTTFAGIALFELITRKTRWGHNTFTHYTHWIS